MNCPRCKSMMVPHFIYDAYVDFAGSGLGAWRCVSCGNVVDPVILQNRQRVAPATITIQDAQEIVHAHLAA